MKKISKILLMLLMIIVFALPVKAEEERADMTVFSFKIVLEHCDQSDPIKVIRFTDNQTGNAAFCLQADQDYTPKLYPYYKTNNQNRRLYELVRAFEMSDHSNDYYIGVQLLIWEALSGIRYSFGGKDAADYHEEEIEEMIDSFNEPAVEERYLNDLELNKEYEIEFADLDDYSISSDTVTVQKKDDSHFSFTLDSKDQDGAVIELSTNDPMDGSFIYHSDNSQDVYEFEGDYVDQELIRYHLTLAEEKEEEDKTTFDLSFSKKDEEGNNIEGAEFTLYEIDPQSDETLHIIRTNEKVNLSDLFMIDNDKTIRVSPRYEKYLDGNIIEPKEPGYFSYRYDDVKGVIYVSDGNELDYAYHVKMIGKYHSEDKDVNVIRDLEKDKKYLLCESEPQKGYSYASDPVVYIDGTAYEDQILSFVNSKREYTLRLYKESEDHKILLNGARFRLTYQEKGETKTTEFVTGALNIMRENDHEYLIYRFEKEDEVHVERFIEDYFIEEGVPEGKYYYYQSDTDSIDHNRLDENYIEVIKGAYEIKGLPYDAILQLKELKAPNGYFIKEADFELEADIPYSEICFYNTRINHFEIIPENRFPLPKTCIGE